MIEQFQTVTVSLELLMDDEIFEQNDETAFRGANREEKVNHPDNRAIAPENEHAPAARLFENQSQTAQLFVFVRAKIALLSEQAAEHLGQFIQISLGSRLNNDFFAHRLHCLFAEIERAGNPRFQGFS